MLGLVKVYGEVKLESIVQGCQLEFGGCEVVVEIGFSWPKKLRLVVVVRCQGNDDEASKDDGLSHRATVPLDGMDNLSIIHSARL